MHTALFEEDSFPQFAQYYLSIKDRSHPVSGHSFEYSLSAEDFYIYLLAHEYKHFSNSGTGLRSLLDVYVYNTAKPDIDREYLDAELQKVGLQAFEEEMRSLSLEVFAPGSDVHSLSEKEQRTLENCYLATPTAR